MGGGVYLLGDLIDLLLSRLNTVAYLGFHFGGGSKFFWKSGVC